MRWSLVLYCAILALASAFALQCPTCRGAECNLPPIPIQECSIHHPFPLQKMPLLTKALQMSYNCLYVEYYSTNKSQELEKMSQCVMIPVGQDVCEALKKTYDIKTCMVKKPLALGVGPDPLQETTTTSPTVVSTAATSIASIVTATTTVASTDALAAETVPTTTTTTTTNSPKITNSTNDPTTKGRADINQMSVTFFLLATIYVCLM